MYRLGFTKKRDGHKFTQKSMFDQFFMHHLKNSKS
ncbi:hypothetical protein MUK42_15534 [Musa troglodytarum]|uniref:Uncharacterized protein n=1 Tax=Musa troglodytarum TaxID=320322 RepID=A0A9E7EYR5_9LILI|nr:hypothetical protein MUK42_15534 [Musa troglodytarum]